MLKDALLHWVIILENDKNDVFHFVSAPITITHFI